MKRAKNENKRALISWLLSCAMLVAFAVPMQACGDCRTVVGGPRTVRGEVSYKPGNQVTKFTSTNVSIWEAGSSRLELHAELVTAASDERRFLSLEVPRLQQGTVRTFTATDDARACVSVRGTIGAVREEYCFPFVGTVDVKTLEIVCSEHESGIATCADNIDATIRGKASESTPPGGQTKTTLDVDLHVMSSERWSDSQCK
jgi:hypothetical protein